MIIFLSTCIPQSKSSLHNQATTYAAIGAPLYSASILDKATVGYFLLLQVRVALPKENMNQLLDLLS